MHIKFIKFAAIGGTNTALDFVIFNIVAHVIGISPFGIPAPVFAQFCSAMILMPVSFLLNRRFTFKSKAKKRYAIIPFICTNVLTGMIIQPLVIFGVTSTFHTLPISEILLNNGAKCCGVALGMIVNFISYHFIFRSIEQLQERNARKHQLLKTVDIRE